VLVVLGVSSQVAALARCRHLRAVTYRIAHQLLGRPNVGNQRSAPRAAAGWVQHWPQQQDGPVCLGGLGVAVRVQCRVGVVRLVSLPLWGAWPAWMAA
jgi:hypothetical protein